MTTSLADWAGPRETSLADLIDRLLHRGVVAAGGVIISLAGVDLVRLDLRVLLASIEKLAAEQVRSESGSSPRQLSSEPPQDEPQAVQRGGSLPQPTPARTKAAAPGAAAGSDRLDLDAETVDRGLGRLVLAVLELLREVLERQSIRHLEGGSLDSDQVERLGLALQALESRLAELRAEFGLDRSDLQIPIAN